MAPGLGNCVEIGFPGQENEPEHRLRVLTSRVCIVCPFVTILERATIPAIFIKMGIHGAHLRGLTLARDVPCTTSFYIMDL